MNADDYIKIGQELGGPVLLFIIILIAMYYNYKLVKGYIK